MRHYFFNGQETPEEIVRILLDNCEGVEQMQYTKKLTEPELAQERENYVDNNIEIGQHNDELQAAKDLHKERVKPLKAENKAALKTLKSKHSEVTGRVFRVPNFDTKMMEFVNEEGTVVHERRLKPDENQTSILKSLQKVS